MKPFLNFLTLIIAITTLAGAQEAPKSEPTNAVEAAAKKEKASVEIDAKYQT